MKGRKEIEEKIFQLEKELEVIDKKLERNLPEEEYSDLMLQKVTIASALEYLKWVLKGKSSKGIEKALNEISRIADLIEESLQNKDSRQVEDAIARIKEGISILRKLPDVTRTASSEETEGKNIYTCPKCGSSRFVLTETVTTTTSMLVDLSRGENSPTPYFKENQVTQQYTLTCCECGRVSMLNEGDYFSAILPEFSEEGIGYDAVGVVEKIRMLGKESLHSNSNLEEGE